jgi:mono/diheme cytochrome c family protein
VFLLAAPPASAAPDGAAIFAERCVACHQADAQGADGLAPSLAGTLKDYLATEDGKQYLSQLLISGMGGRIESQGRVVTGLMPSFAADLNDADIAAVLGYVLARFNGVTSPTPIAGAAIAAARAHPPTPTQTRKLREKIKEAAK